MGEAAKLLARLSFEEYLALEERVPRKHELVDGVMYAMAGASDRHNRIVVNLVLALGPAARQRGCALYASDMKLRVGRDTSYYPDLMVLCQPDAGEYYKERPCLVIEVLSASTEATDRREKLAHYRRIPSLEAYLLVDSRVRRAEGYYRQGEQWLYAEAVGAGEVRVPCLEVKLGLEEIYQGLDLPQEWQEEG
ncbi:Uma2 family endonuclease [Meiothermus sp. PNK-Is4]|uniref:Uma2 family endonuclease n=1 Tax=Meiothermus sp. PNK-Is4 TaxID=2740565 RepID=UPI0010219F2A|nr:Uma2 family endonuclease [Meiothermus sp. PNK-Is4]RYM33232.1 Uma2 family endonuclease [Meiothermus sp. PNK-Is4]